MLSRLFGFSTDEDEEDDSATPARAESRVAAAAKPAQEARIPTPPARPAINPKPAGGFALASATSTPVTLPSRTVPRPPADVAEPSEVSASRGETTSSITSWLNDAEFGRTDRVPPGMALAYAASASSPDGRRPTALTPPIGDARAAPAATTQVARIPPRAGQRYNDPWLRGITLATSVHYTMNVTVYGKLDVRQVRMMMIKPVASVPMTFGNDPYQGMQTLSFGGAAVTFLPTVSYGAPQRQASLR